MSNRLLRLLVHGFLGILFFLSLVFFGLDNYRAGSPISMVLLNSLLLAIPLFALFFSAALLFEAWLRHRQAALGPRFKKLLYYTPRIAGIVIALFISLFALDVFELNGTVWQKIGAFLIHAAPALILLAVMALAWRWPWVGTLVFGLAALFFLRFVFGGREFAFGNLLLFVLPLGIVAALFWLNWRWKGELKPAG